MTVTYIHIGMHKTGSSSIQETFFRKQTDDSFQYLHLGKPNSSLGLRFGFWSVARAMAREATLTRDGFLVRRQRVRKQLGETLASSRSLKRLLSAEAIAHFRDPEVEELAQFFGCFAGSVQVVGYIRRPKSFMESAYQETLKAGYKPFGDVVLRSDYRKRFCHFDKAFGPENVKLWLFDRSELHGGDVVLDISKRLEISLEGVSVVRVNEAMCGKAVKLLYVYRKKFGSRQTGDDAVVELLQRLRGPPFRLHSSVFSGLLDSESYRETLKWSEKRFGIDLSENFEVDDEIADAGENAMASIHGDVRDEVVSFLPQTFVKTQKLDRNSDIADILNAYRIERLAEVDPQIRL